MGTRYCRTELCDRWKSICPCPTCSEIMSLKRPSYSILMQLLKQYPRVGRSDHSEVLLTRVFALMSVLKSSLYRKQRKINSGRETEGLLNEMYWAITFMEAKKGKWGTPKGDNGCQPRMGGMYTARSKCKRWGNGGKKVHLKVYPLICPRAELWIPKDSGVVAGNHQQAPSLVWSTGETSELGKKYPHMWERGKRSRHPRWGQYSKQTQ